MGIVVAVVAAVIIVAAVAVGVVLARRRGRGIATPPDRTPVRPEPAPMTKLEAALADVTEHTGTITPGRSDATGGGAEPLDDEPGGRLRRALDGLEPWPPPAGDERPPPG